MFVVLTSMLILGCATDEQAASLSDRDGDGFNGVAVGGSDCDDDDPNVHPEANERCGDNVDNNCDGQVDDDGDGAVAYFRDEDGDGFGQAAMRACEVPAGGVVSAGDCDDLDPTRHPNAVEACDGVDQDCDGEADQGLESIPVFVDEDGDGYGSSSQPELRCDVPEGYSDADGDCDDSNPSRFPGNSERCDGLDQDCDAEVDEGLAVQPWFPDADGDGSGDDAGAVAACDAPTSMVSDGGDCDDNDPMRSHLLPEVCLDGIDQDCAGPTATCVADALPIVAPAPTDTVETGAFGLLPIPTGDLDGDGREDFAFQASDGVHWWSAGDALNLANRQRVVGAHTLARADHDTDDDGVSEIVAVTANGELTAWAGDGEERWRSAWSGEVTSWAWSLGTLVWVTDEERVWSMEGWPQPDGVVTPDPSESMPFTLVAGARIVAVGSAGSLTNGDHGGWVFGVSGASGGAVYVAALDGRPEGDVGFLPSRMTDRPVTLPSDQHDVDGDGHVDLFWFEPRSAGGGVIHLVYGPAQAATPEDHHSWEHASELGGQLLTHIPRVSSSAPAPCVFIGEGTTEKRGSFECWIDAGHRYREVPGAPGACAVSADRAWCATEAGRVTTFALLVD